jgi:hypothetical protein
VTAGKDGVGELARVDFSEGITVEEGFAADGMVGVASRPELRLVGTGAGEFSVTDRGVAGGTIGPHAETSARSTRMTKKSLDIQTTDFLYQFLSVLFRGIRGIRVGFLTEM